jgi:hypothetical protein
MALLGDFWPEAGYAETSTMSIRKYFMFSLTSGVIAILVRLSADKNDSNQLVAGG